MLTYAAHWFKTRGEIAVEKSRYHSNQLTVHLFDLIGGLIVWTVIQIISVSTFINVSASTAEMHSLHSTEVTCYRYYCKCSI